MSAIDTLLSRLDGVRQVKSNAWMTRCPAHNGEGSSMSVTHCEDGRILVHCFAYGCDIGDILDALSMSVSDLFPERLPQHRYAPRKHGVSPIDVVRALKHELLVVYFIAEEIAADALLPQFEAQLRARIQQSATRIKTAIALCDG